MEKQKRVLDLPKIILYSLELIVIILAASFFYFSAHGKDYTNLYSTDVQRETIESLIVALKLYNVHEIPYTSITPKMQIYIKEDLYYVNSYYIEIVKGEIIVHDGETDEEDIIIRTTKEEVLKIIENKDYARESLASGGIIIEKVAGKFVLFSKGYTTLNNGFSASL